MATFFLLDSPDNRKFATFPFPFPFPSPSPSPSFSDTTNPGENGPSFPPGGKREIRDLAESCIFIIWRVLGIPGIAPSVGCWLPTEAETSHVGLGGTMVFCFAIRQLHFVQEDRRWLRSRDHVTPFRWRLCVDRER